jgi:acetyl esterase
MNKTYEEKLEMAKKMREKSVFAANQPDELVEIYRQTRKEERYLPTSKGDCKVYVYYPNNVNSSPHPAYINMHGGGFVRQWRENDAFFCCAMVLWTGCVCVDIDYKLAPEHPYPAAVYEVHDAINWVFNHAGEMGIDTRRIVVGGHSAGGNLALVSSMLAQKNKTFYAKSLIMDYPGVDNHKDPDELRKVEGAMPLERMRAFMSLYHENQEQAKESYSSPLLAADSELSGLPPVTVITAEIDNLRDDGEAFARRLVELGVPVTMRRFLKSRHGFMINFVDEYKEGMEFYAGTLKAAFGS